MNGVGVGSQKSRGVGLPTCCRSSFRVGEMPSGNKRRRPSLQRERGAATGRQANAPRLLAAHADASSADGYLIVELNKMVLPAGQLQPPFFNPDATDAVNYGAFGIYSRA